DTTSAQRFFTTVPQQALFLLNSPFVLDQAKALVHGDKFQKLIVEGRGSRVEGQKAQAFDSRLSTLDPAINFLYRTIFQRAANSEDLKLTRAFLKRQSQRPPPADTPTWQYGFGAFDDATGKTKDFHAFTQFTDNRWQYSAKFPDP